MFRHPGVNAAGPNFDGDWWLESAAMAASESVLEVPLSIVSAIRDSVAARPVYRAQPRPTHVMPAGSGEAMRAYLLALLSLRLQDTVAVVKHAAALHDAAQRAGRAAASLEIALTAERLRAAGRAADALAALEAYPFDITEFDYWHGSARERFVRAELLRALDRDAKALPVYESLWSNAELPWMAVARLRQARIHERAGRRAEAAFNYRRFIGLWRGADAPFQPRVAEARAALDRVR